MVPHAASSLPPKDIRFAHADPTFWRIPGQEVSKVAVVPPTIRLLGEIGYSGNEVKKILPVCSFILRAAENMIRCLSSDFGLRGVAMKIIKRGILAAPMVFLMLFLISPVGSAQNKKQQAPNQVLGEVQFVGPDKAEKTSGVWIDGQYVGYVAELKDDKKVMLLPGTHEISFRQTGYLDSTQSYVVEPGKKLIITVRLDKDPKAEYSTVTSEIKLKVTPDRAAVFVDGSFAGYVKQFSGMGRGMLVSPGDHHIKIALAGYQEFNTDVKLLPKQKITLKTELAAGSITQAPPAIKQD